MHDSAGSPAPPTVSVTSSQWPTTLSVIAATFALIAFLINGGCLYSFARLQMGPAAPPLSVTAMTTVAGLLLSTLLLFAAMSLYRRVRRSVAYLRLWSVLHVLWVPASIILCSLTQPAALPGSVVMPVSSHAGGATGFVFAILLSFTAWLALPAFLLAWFARPSVKAEVLIWSKRSANPSPSRGRQTARDGEPVL